MHTKEYACSPLIFSIFDPLNQGLWPNFKRPRTLISPKACGKNVKWDILLCSLCGPICLLVPRNPASPQISPNGWDSARIQIEGLETKSVRTNTPNTCRLANGNCPDDFRSHYHPFGIQRQGYSYQFLVGGMSAMCSRTSFIGRSLQTIPATGLFSWFVSLRQSPTCHWIFSQILKYPNPGGISQ